MDRYPDGDVAVQLLDSVRRKEVFLVQPTSPPVNNHLIELLALADACRRAGAERISAIVIMVRVVADLLEVVGISHIVTVDRGQPNGRTNALPGFALAISS